MTQAERIASLESALSLMQLRQRLLLIALVVVVVAATLLLSSNASNAATHQKSNEIRTSRLVIEDSSGATRAVLQTLSAGTGLTIYDQTDTARVRLQCRDDGVADFQLSDPNGRTRVSIEVGAERTLGLNLSDENGRPRILLGLDKDTGPNFHYADGHGNIQMSLACTLGAFPEFALRNAANTRSASMGIAILDAPYVSVSEDNEQNGKVRLSVIDGRSTLLLCDEDGDKRIAVEVPKIGSPYISIQDKRGEETFRAPSK